MHLKQSLFLCLCRSQWWRETKNSFSFEKQIFPFWGPKKIQTNITFRIFFLAIVLWSKMKVVEKINPHQTSTSPYPCSNALALSLWFFDNARQKSPIFWNWTHKNKPDWQQCVQSSKTTTKKFEITPPIQYKHCLNRYDSWEL